MAAEAAPTTAGPGITQEQYQQVHGCLGFVGGVACHGSAAAACVAMRKRAGGGTPGALVVGRVEHCGGAAGVRIWSHVGMRIGVSRLAVSVAIMRTAARCPRARSPPLTARPSAC